MAQCNRHRPQGQPPIACSNPTPRTNTDTDPPMKCWPHPIPTCQTPLSGRGDESTAHYVRCSLAYQNQLLADIKSLLQQLVQQSQDGKTTE